MSVPTRRGEPLRAMSASSPPLLPPAVSQAFLGFLVLPKMWLSKSADCELRISKCRVWRPMELATDHHGLRDICLDVKHPTSRQDDIYQGKILRT